MLNTTFHEMVFQMRKAQKTNSPDKTQLETYVDNELTAFDEMMQAKTARYEAIKNNEEI